MKHHYLFIIISHIYWQERKRGEPKKMKVYHMSSKRDLDDLQVIFVASDDSEGINNIKDLYAQITVRRKQKTIEMLIPEDLLVRQFIKRG